jgi:Cache domain
MTPNVPRLNIRAFTVWLLLAVPALAVGVVLVLAFGQARLSTSYAHHLEQLAHQTAAGVDAYVYRRMVDVSLVARTPDLRREAAASSARPLDRHAADVLDQQMHQGPRNPPSAIAALLDSPASRYLRDLVNHDRIYRELLLTDSQGRLVAASNLPSDYFQGDEDWWMAARDDGRRGRVTLSDVRWDQSAHIHAIEIAVPVPGVDTEDLVGVLKAVTDSREMLALVGSVQLGDSGTAWLLRRNGSIVFSRTVTDPNARFWAADAVKNRMDAQRQSGTIGGSYFEGTAPDGTPQLVGLAESQLGASFPSVPWVIAVAQARDELLAPVRTVGWYLLLLVAALAILVLALALWFSVRLGAPQVDVDMHLVDHPLISHVGELSSRETREVPDRRVPG